MKQMMLLMVLALMFGMVGFTQAQADMPVPCGDLAEADCEILQQNQQAMMDLESYAFAASADFTLANIPDMPQDVSFSLVGNGAVIGSAAAIQMAPEDVMSMMSDPEAYADYLESVFTTFDLRLSLLLTVPEALVESSGGELPSSIPLDVVLADGIGYLNLSTLGDAIGEAGESFPEGWYGIDLVGLIDQVMAMSGSMGSMDAMEMDPSLFSHFTDPEFVSDFTRIERLDDTTAGDGTAVASFHTVIDYQALMSDPAIQDLMVESMAAQGTEMTDAELEQMSAMISQMFGGLTLDIFTTIGLEDFYTRSTQVTMNFNMESIMAVAAEMGDNTDMEGPAPALMFNLIATNSDFNAVEEITAPENATVVPLESLGIMGDTTIEAMPMTLPTETPSK